MYDWETVKPYIKYVTLILLTIIMLTPLAFAFQMSFRSPISVISSSPGIPYVTFDPPACGNGLAWCSMWDQVPVVEYTIATFVTAFGTALLATITATFAAYSFARLKFSMKETLFTASVAGFVFPKVLLAIPL
ncbi:MAG: hypothetical protein ABEI52_04690, partial [Halobacteriaceae archaeon]